MSEILLETKIVCIELDCGSPLGYFDIKNKNRFCRKCTAFHRPLRWKCEGCDVILTNCTCRETRRLCDNCQRKFKTHG